MPQGSTVIHLAFRYHHVACNAEAGSLQEPTYDERVRTTLPVEIFSEPWTDSVLQHEAADSVRQSNRQERQSKRQLASTGSVRRPRSLRGQGQRDWSLRVSGGELSNLLSLGCHSKGSLGSLIEYHMSIGHRFRNWTGLVVFGCIGHRR
jgi:hypothetical protein